MLSIHDSAKCPIIVSGAFIKWRSGDRSAERVVHAVVESHLIIVFSRHEVTFQRLALIDLAAVERHHRLGVILLQAAHGARGVQVEQEHGCLAVVSRSRGGHAARHRVLVGITHPRGGLSLACQDDALAIDEACTARLMARAVEAGNIVAVSAREEAEGIRPIITQAGAQKCLPGSLAVFLHIAVITTRVLALWV